MHSITGNFRSGIVVFLIAIPLCLGIALACKAPPLSGIVAGIVGGIVVAAISGSSLSVSGPAAGLTSIVLASVAALGSFNLFVAAVIAAGVIQVLLGIARAGTIGNYIPSAVIKGMLAAIGIILVVKQLPHLVGYDADPEGDLDFERAGGGNTFSDLAGMFANLSFGAIVVSVVSFGILLAGESAAYKRSRVLSSIPAPLLAVLSGIAIHLAVEGTPGWTIAQQHRVNLPSLSSPADIFSAIAFADFSMIRSAKFWEISLTLAAVASLESLLSLEATERLDPRRRNADSNRELVAQGAGNVVSGLLGGLPVTAVIVRSTANISAGATSRISAIVHGALLLVTVVFIPHLLTLIPNAALAVILIFIGYKLATPTLIRQQYIGGAAQFVPFVVTIVVMLVTDLLRGVCAGIVVAVIYIIRANIRIAAETVVEKIDGRLIHLIRLPQHITFFNKGFFVRYLRAVENNSTVIIDGTNNTSTDPDVKEVFADFISNAPEKGITVQTIKHN